MSVLCQCQLHYHPLAASGCRSKAQCQLRSWIRAHNKLYEAEQLLGLLQYTFLFALYQSWTLIEIELLKCIISWNWRKSRQTCVWTNQDFSSSITGSDYSLLLAHIKWERNARKAQASSKLVYFLMLAVLATPRTKCSIQWDFFSKYLLMPVPYCPFYHSRWNSVLSCAWNLRPANLQKLGQIFFSLINLWSCSKQANKLVCSNLNYY